MGVCCSSRSIVIGDALGKGNRIHDLESSRNAAQSSEEKEQRSQVSRDNAEKLLINAKTGAYLLSHDITSELFISVKCEQYVSHHAVSKTATGLRIGGEQFNSTAEMTSFFKTHPIGDTILSFEFTTPENSIRKENSKGSRSKSDNSWQLNTFSSPEHSSEFVTSVDGKISKGHLSDNQKHEFKEVEEEKLSQYDCNIVTVHSSQKIDNNDVDNKSLQSVSSAGDMDFPVDEPLPVLPAPSGRRPPPLIPFAEEHFRHTSTLKTADINNITKNLTGKDFSWNPYISTKMIKVIVCGSPDTLGEREHFCNNCLPELMELCYKYGFHCDVTHSRGTSQIVPNKGLGNTVWEIGEKTTILNSMETRYLKQFGVPVLVVLFTASVSRLQNAAGGILGPPTIPRKLSKEEFEKMSKLLSDDQFAHLSESYSRDDNDLHLPYILKNETVADQEKLKYLQDICLNILAKCFEGEQDLLKCFVPETERNIGFLMKHCKEIDFVLIEKTFEKMDKNDVSWNNEQQMLNNNHDGNLHYRLNLKENDTLLKLKESRSIRENDVVRLKWCGEDLESSSNFHFNVNATVVPLVKKKLFEIMQSFPSERKKIRCLEDEIFAHLIECHTALSDGIPQPDELTTIKAYLQGPYKKPLILHGSNSIHSLIAKAGQVALEWFGGNACIITRFVGLTQDSTSLRLLLRSICLQLSLAYNTDPAAVPQDLSELVQFLPSMFRFATESQPMVLCIAGLTEIEVYNTEFQCFHLLPTILCENVKFLVSIDEASVTHAESIYKDVNSFKRVKDESLQDGIELLDSLLVSADKTVSEEQKILISDSLSNCWSSFYIKMLFDEVSNLHSSDIVKISKADNLEDYISYFFHETEERFGKEIVEVVCGLITISKFGVTKRCLNYVLLRKLAEKETKLKQEGQLNRTISAVLNRFSRLVKTTLIHDFLYFNWSHQTINRVAKHRYLDQRFVFDQIISRIIEFFSDEPNKYDIVDLQRNEAAIENEATKMQHSTHSLSNSIAYNWEKLQFFPHILIKARQLDRIKQFALCNFDFLFDKLRATSVSHILNNLNQALVLEPQDVDLKIVMEIFELSVEALTFDVEQFPAQIAARMLPVKMDCGEKALDITCKGDAEPMHTQYEIAPNATDSSENGSSKIDDSKDQQINISFEKINHTQNNCNKNDVELQNTEKDSAKPVSNKNGLFTSSNEASKEHKNDRENQTDSSTDQSLVLHEGNENSNSPKSLYLTTFVKTAIKTYHPLMPAVRCLIRPPSDCGVFPESQISSWQANDTRILFLEKNPGHFVSWSVKKQTIMLFDSNCRLLQSHRGLAIKRVLLAYKLNLILELANGTFHIYDVKHGELTSTLDSGPCYFAVCDDVHIAAMSRDMTCLNVYDTRSNEITWQFHAPDKRSFQNVLISRNGEIGACLVEGVFSSKVMIPEKKARNAQDDICCSENIIIVVNLKSRQLLHSIIVEENQIFNELCAISEDGHFFAHVTEQGYQILVWDLIKGTLIHELETRLHRVIKILLSSQGNSILSISADSVLRIWNLSDGELRFTLSEPISSIRGGYMDDTHCVSMSEDGRRAVHSLKSRFHCSYIVLWDLVQGKQIGTLTTDFYGLTYEISPDGTYVVAGMPSGIVTLGIN